MAELSEIDGALERPFAVTPALASLDSHGSGQANLLCGPGSTGGVDALALLLKRVRDFRDRQFGSYQMCEPAWDLLLDLFVAQRRQQRISVSSACIAARVPPTTALRHLRHLERSGLIERVPDPEDGRRQFVQLTASGADAISTILGRSLRQSPGPCASRLGPRED